MRSDLARTDVSDEIAMFLIAAGVVVRGGFLVRDLERLRRKAEQSERRFPHGVRACADRDSRSAGTG